MTQKCSRCNEDGPDINCNLCKIRFHGSCAGLSRSEISCIKSANRKLKFFCDECLDLKSWSKKIVDLQSELKDLKTEVSSLKSLLDEKITERSVNAVDNSSINQNSDCNMIINEVLERQKREANVIMFNVTESQKSHIPKEFQKTLFWLKNILN
ncbi:hypothetical protein Zmor_024360 [Zophobas morio]|uniref:Zinc finger PHD-type domain-containing protein n=1 Tax=Zophobas morio TaxID=2755281 RepID=A0AA38I060_9CUCU|nr:hypothetical protein Zmor_024360 [Zophobas morio]